MSEKSPARYQRTGRAKLAKPFINKTELGPAERDETVPVFMETLSEEDRMRAFQLADQLDLNHQEAVLSFGMPAQSNLLSLTDTMLEYVKKNEVSEAGGIINILMEKLNEVQLDELTGTRKPFFMRMFSRHSGTVRETVSKYQKISAQMDRISVKLVRSKNILFSDINVLEKLYEQNQAYYETLAVYITAGQMRLDQLYSQTIPERKTKLESAADQMAVQEANDLIQLADLLDKRLYDLKIGRETAGQNAAQIRMLQHTNQVLIEKIQSSILTTIPLWRNQMAIALTILQQQRAKEAKAQAEETTTRLFRSHTSFLKKAASETGNDPEEMRILRKTQENLISIVAETLKLEEEGRNRRQQAEHELVMIRDRSLSR